jgi:O-antigen ligase
MEGGPRSLNASWVALGIAGAAALGVVAVAAAVSAGAITLDGGAIALGMAAITVSLGYLALQVNPAFAFAAALVLTPFAANWDVLGIPGPLSPDRLLLVTAIGATLVRMARSRELLQIRLQPVHWALIAAIVLIVVSGFGHEILLEKGAFIRALQIWGILPFLAFFVAPYAFRTQEDRMILLAAMVAMGAYLGLTALFETIGLRQFVFPSYINDPDFGTHFGRARGPFVEAVTNGIALYVCTVASTIAFFAWKKVSARLIAGSVATLCLFGCFFTLQRSVWLGTVVATLLALLAVRQLRRYILPTIIAGFAVVLVALALVPGLSANVSERSSTQGTIWGRESTNAAAINMVEARPLTGFGLDQFDEQSGPYFQLSDDYPLLKTAVHNLFLSYAADLGLPGVFLWTLAFALAVGAALLLRAPPELRPWQIGLIAVAAFYLIVANFVPPAVYPNLIVWLWAGVVWAAHPSIPRSADDRQPA